jgi:hypothetical protein
MRIQSVVIKKLNFSFQTTFYKNGKKWTEHEIHAKHKELYMSLLCCCGLRSIHFNLETIKKTFRIRELLLSVPSSTYGTRGFSLREGYTNIAVLWNMAREPSRWICCFHLRDRRVITRKREATSSVETWILLSSGIWHVSLRDESAASICVTEKWSPERERQHLPSKHEYCCPLEYGTCKYLRAFAMNLLLPFSLQKSDHPKERGNIFRRNMNKYLSDCMV